MKGLLEADARRNARISKHAWFSCILLSIGALSLVSQIAFTKSTRRDAMYKHELNKYEAGFAQCAQINVRPNVEISASRKNPRFVSGTVPTLIKNASLIDGDGEISFRTNIYMEDGVFTEIKPYDLDNFDISKEVMVYDVQGRWVTPGIVDMHSHAGVDSYPEFWGSEDTNELSSPITSQMRTIDAIHTDDVMIKRIMSGGITTSLILPGSANLIGGEAFVIKHAEQESFKVEDYLLQNGVSGKRQRWIKMACGENPKRVYPKLTNTRMGEAWGFRHRFDEARTLMRAQDAWCAAASEGSSAVSGRDFPSDLELETMVGVLRGDVQINNHCYTTGDLEMQIRNSREFDFEIGAFHHALEAYKVPGMLKDAPGNITVATFSNLWGYKKEAFAGSAWAGKILTDAGVPLAYKSDHPVTNSQNLIYQSQIATHFDLSDSYAIKAVTSVPAESLGLGHRIGYVRAGYDADLVVWNDYPLDLGAHPIQVWIDGAAQLDFQHPDLPAYSPVISSAEQQQERHQQVSELAACKEGSKDFVITGIVKDFVGLSSLSSSVEGPKTLVIADGKVACFDTDAACQDVSTKATLAGAQTVPIADAHIVPGIVTPAPGLGLVEIEAESSTADGPVDESKPLDPSTVITAFDGLVFGGPHFERAEKMGVSVAITAPEGSFMHGISTAFKLSGTSVLDAHSIVKKEVAMHFTIGHDAKGEPGTGTSSISSQLKTVRTLVAEGKGVYGRLSNGTLPLVVEAHDSDAIAHLILLKREFPDLYLVVKGGTEAHKVAAELAVEKVPVLFYPRCMPATWRTRDCLPGPPLSSTTGLSVLLHAGVTVGLVGNDDGNLGEGYWEAAWAAKLIEEDDIFLTDAAVIDLVSKNVREILRLEDDGKGNAKGGETAQEPVTRDDTFLVFRGSPLHLKSQLMVSVDAGAVRYCVPRVA